LRLPGYADSYRELFGTWPNLLATILDSSPIFSGSTDEARRWSREPREFFPQEELKDLEAVHDMGQLELLMLRLPELVGSPLSINSFTEDLQISHKT
jgi:uncharacterized protein